MFMNDNVWGTEPIKRLGHIVKLDAVITFLHTFPNVIDDASEEDKLIIEQSLAILQKHRTDILNDPESAELPVNHLIARL